MELSSIAKPHANAVAVLFKTHAVGVEVHEFRRQCVEKDRLEFISMDHHGGHRVPSLKRNMQDYRSVGRSKRAGNDRCSAANDPLREIDSVKACQGIRPKGYTGAYPALTGPSLKDDSIHSDVAQRDGRRQATHSPTDYRDAHTRAA